MIRIHQDGGKMNRKGMKYQNSNKVMSLDPTPNDALTSHPLVITKAGDDELCKEAIEVTPEEEWVERVEMVI